MSIWPSRPSYICWDSTVQDHFASSRRCSPMLIMFWKLGSSLFSSTVSTLLSVPICSSHNSSLPFCLGVTGLSDFSLSFGRIVSAWFRSTKTFCKSASTPSIIPFSSTLGCFANFVACNFIGTWQGISNTRGQQDNAVVHHVRVQSLGESLTMLAMSGIDTSAFGHPVRSSHFEEMEFCL